MAGDWIKWTVGFSEKREVRMIASRFQRDRFEVSGRLMRLFEWTDSNILDDDIDDDTGDASIEMGEDWKALVDDIAGLPGLSDMLASPGICWLSARSGGRVVFHKLGRHNGETAKSRAQSNKRQKKSRSKRDNCHGDTVTKALPEKRREECINTHTQPAEIPSLDEVKKAFSTEAFTSEQIEDKYLYMDNKYGWIKPDGSIKDWRKLIRHWCQNDRAKNPTAGRGQASAPAAKAASPWEIEKLIERKEAEMRSLKERGYNSDSHMTCWTQKDLHAEWKALRDQVKELKQKHEEAVLAKL